jgi:hypothetical protein
MRLHMRHLRPAGTLFAPADERSHVWEIPTQIFGFINMKTSA